MAKLKNNRLDFNKIRISGYIKQELHHSESKPGIYYHKSTAFTADGQEVDEEEGEEEEEEEEEEKEETGEDEEEVTISINEFQELAAKKESLFIKMRESQIHNKIEAFWKDLPKRADEGDKQKRLFYASDVEDFLFSHRLPGKHWNINKFTGRESLIHSMQKKLWMAGIHESFLYIGTNFTTFSFHVEDHNLNSISFLHHGAPKVWYAIAEKDRAAFEELCNGGLDADLYEGCDQPMRHKTVFVDRKLLEEAKFTVTEVCYLNSFFSISILFQ